MGTAPEVIQSYHYTTKADMWSFGVIIYMFICGFPPFLDQTGNEQKLIQMIKRGKFEFVKVYFKECDPSIMDLITKLLCKQPGQRLSAADARKHEWFTGIKAEVIQQEDEVYAKMLKEDKKEDKRLVIAPYKQQSKRKIKNKKQQNTINQYGQQNSMNEYAQQNNMIMSQYGQQQQQQNNMNGNQMQQYGQNGYQQQMNQYQQYNMYQYAQPQQSQQPGSVIVVEPGGQGKQNMNNMQYGQQNQYQQQQPGGQMQYDQNLQYMQQNMNQYGQQQQPGTGNQMRF